VLLKQSRVLALAATFTLMAAPVSAAPSVAKVPRGFNPPQPTSETVDGAGAVAGAGAADRPLRPGPGYWLAGADGGVFAYGRAHFAGAAAAQPLRSGISGMAATPSGQGYWLVARDGGVFAFGDAPFLGAPAGSRPLNSSTVAVASSPSGQGYWIGGSDGGVFAYGDAPFLGGLASAPLNQPIVSMAATPTGQGYWLVARDGGVFAFGDAPFLGGAAGAALNRGVVSIAATPSGHGYWLTGADGGVFAYGDAGYFGSALGANPAAPIVGLAPTRSGTGYWVAGADGGVFAFGDAGYYGAASEDGTNARVVAVAAGIGSDVRTQARALSGTFGWDVSWPQCGSKLPAGGYAYAIVGVTHGHQFSENPCLASEYRWALRHGSVASLYVNVNWPSRAEEPELAARMADVCGAHDLPCQLYWWGRRGSEHALAAANAHHISAPMWWLDVETTNRWSPDPALNTVIVKGARDGMELAHVRVGVYSSPYQWQMITGDYAPGLPTWVAGPMDAAGAQASCAEDRSFGGGAPWLVQFPNGLDGNILCEAGVHGLLGSFRTPPPPAVPEFPADLPAKLR
jgi:hypothetical protein